MDVSEHRRLCIVGDRFFLERHGALVDALAQTFGGTEVLSIAPAASRRERAVSAADGLPEIVRDGECGFVDPDPSAESLARHILRVFSDAALQRRFSEASRRRVASDLLWSHVARRIAGVLRPDLPAFPERELVASRS
jgi:glycosyltransferase involved in cell wall biosynthesis